MRCCPRVCIARAWCASMHAADASMHAAAPPRKAPRHLFGHRKHPLRHLFRHLFRHPFGHPFGRRLGLAGGRWGHVHVACTCHVCAPVRSTARIGRWAVGRLPCRQTTLPPNAPRLMDTLMRVHGYQLLADGVFNADTHAGNSLHTCMCIHTHMVMHTHARTHARMHVHMPLHMDGILTADTLAGNFLLMPDDRIALIDYGATKRLSRAGSTQTVSRQHMHMHTHAHAHACTCTCTRMHMHTHAHTHACTCTRMHMHMHTHAHAHACTAVSSRETLGVLPVRRAREGRR